MVNKVEMHNIEKSFPGVKALTNISMEIRPGEVLVILGENGAGKSTLMKILAGVQKPDSGQVFFKGQNIEINSTKDAERYGIYMIYQELNLVPHLSVAENIFLGREFSTKTGFIKWKQMYEEAENVLKRLNLTIDPRTIVEDLSVAQSQMVEIARALSTNAEVLIMDEPTAAITNQETEELFRQIEKLKASGVSILYISHRLQEVMEISDRVFVMRDGAHVGTLNTNETDTNELIRLMVGREIGDLYPKVRSDVGEEVFRVEHLSIPGVLHDISFSVRAGEVLGFAGLMGAGRTELMDAIFGGNRSMTGDIYINNKKVTINSPEDAVKHGMAYVTEDRKKTGLILSFPIDLNITLASIRKSTKYSFIDHHREEELAKQSMDGLKVKAPNQNTLVSTLSGGNQQKVVLGKWLQTNSQIIILDEPTRGIDVNSKREIYLLINGLTKAGKAVIMVSSDIPEILGMSERVAVLSEGHLTGILPIEEANQITIMELATQDTRI
ncbi:sugar ABC transporter ATP-binding protein [Neobacillus notoginsengisoli]|uniref:Sugar ABC transporter ATP-binding protein n=1 Tax=Neobacillus notoginsengisoli TaxID=1578198 RepID=A0A417YIL8_9BACI|nr:sugar ABC transporter ATP-binding protein [Neobacillus notoginsengisoli]RHW32842.1 sugar ABC transporter ATP-binding protein [Neobacillus notoginsengisoli]